MAVVAPTVSQAPAAAHQAGQGPLWLGVVMLVVLAAALATALWAWRLNRRALRSCPLCSDTAVRALDEQVFSGLHALVSLECGQCGTWRRVATTPAYARGLARTLRSDREAIIDGIERLAAERRRGEVDALTRPLGGG